MKKASIITLQYIDNFGSVLQTFATQEIVKRFGYEGEIVNYRRENCSYEYQKKAAFDRYRQRGDFLSLYVFSKILELRWAIIFKRRFRVFENFRNKYLNLTKKYSSLEELKQNPPYADAYITGSDQVWNVEYNGGVLGEYFLEYAPENSLRIALSASIGTENISQDEMQIMKKYVDRYDGISVRESTAVRTLQQLGYNSAIQVIDPTLMLTKQQWVDKLQLKHSEKTGVLLYQLNENQKMIDFATKLARENNIPLYIISASCKKANCEYKVVNNCSPEKFLELMYCSDYVVTDSFHGTAFSFNFNKDVFVFSPPRYSTRLSSFLTLVESSFRLCDEVEEWKNVESIDFGKVNAVLENERKKVDEFLSLYLVS